MTDKIQYGLSTIFCWRDLIIGDITFNGKEVQTVAHYDHKSHLWVISNIFVYEEGAKEVKIKVDPFVQLNCNNLSEHTDPDWLYRFIGKVSHIVYLNIAVLILAYNCGGTVTNILYQILSENMSKPTESLVRTILESKYRL